MDIIYENLDSHCGKSW